jgi:hypothetical protein
MPPRHLLPEASRLDREKVAYWYFRLNGFLQLENFVIHPRSRGGQRTDADLLAVRFPSRAERLHDDAGDIMADDEGTLGLSRDVVDVVIAEVKRGPCALNGPWTKPSDGNVQRVLAAIGCIPHDRIDAAADDIYRRGAHESETGLRIRLVCVGREPCVAIAEQYPEVKQVSWEALLGFIWHRLRRFRHQKRQTDQWETTGGTLKSYVSQARNEEDFIRNCLRAMDYLDAAPAILPGTEGGTLSTAVTPTYQTKPTRGRFFGPCSGADLPLAFEVAADAVDRFTFCDLSYIARDASAAYAVPRGWTLISRVGGRDERQPAKSTWYNGHRQIHPWVTLEVWRRPDDSECYVELRGDLAEDALLQQFPPRSISFFMHLNDGAGEGGSGLWFLSKTGMPTDVRRGKGFLDAVVSRLIDGAVVLTDGALAEDGFLKDQDFESASVRWTPLAPPLGARSSRRQVGLWRAQHSQ